MADLVSRSVRLTADTEPRSAGEAMVRDLWREVAAVDAADRASVEAAVDLLLAAVFPRAGSPSAEVCSLLVTVSDDRVEVTAAVAGAAPPDDRRSEAQEEVAAALRDLVDLVRRRQHGSITEWLAVRARAHARRYAALAGDGSGAADVAAELQRQRALDELHVLEQPDNDRFDRLTRLALELFGVSNSAVNLVDRDHTWSRSLAGGGDRTVPRTRSLCNVTITQDDAYVVTDIGADPRASAIVGPDAQFYAGLPLYARGGERVGAFCIYDSQPRAFSSRDEAVLRDLAALAQQELSVSREAARGAHARRRLSPGEAPAAAGWSIAGFSLTEQGFGAEFVDWNASGGAITFSIGDAGDSGAGGAILAATVRAALRTVAATQDRGGSDAVERAVAAAASVLGEDPDDHETAVTLFHARIDPASGNLDYVDAGHGLAMLIGADGGRAELPSTEPPLGGARLSSSRVGSRRLGHGDALLVVSDGALDLVGGGATALERLAAAAGSSRDPDTFVSALRDRVGPRPRQDVTAFMIRRERAG